MANDADINRHRPKPGIQRRQHFCPYGCIELAEIILPEKVPRHIHELTGRVQFLSANRYRQQQDNDYCLREMNNGLSDVCGPELNTDILQLKFLWSLECGIGDSPPLIGSRRRLTDFNLRS